VALSRGDSRVPGHASGHDDEELAQQGAGDGGSGLAVLGRVGGPAGEVTLLGHADVREVTYLPRGRYRLSP
jgi:hypothetical protein